jgi:hypothetical protein
MTSAKGELSLVVVKGGQDVGAITNSILPILGVVTIVTYVYYVYYTIHHETCCQIKPARGSGEFVSLLRCRRNIL